MANSNATNIQEHMTVFGSCGNQIGVVDKVEGDKIKLTRNSSPDGEHHYIPVTWVDTVTDTVRLNKDCGQAQKEWTTA